MYRMYTKEITTLGAFPLLAAYVCLFIFFRKRMHEKFTRDILQAAAVYFLPSSAASRKSNIL